MHDTLGHGAHQLRLRLDEGGGRLGHVAAGHALIKLAQEGADARAARLVDLGAASDLADRLLGAGIIGHGSRASNGQGGGLDPAVAGGDAQETVGRRRS